MRKLNVSSLAIPLVVFGICTTFQNCDAGFHYDPSTAELSSSGETDLTGVFGVVGYAPGGTSPLSDTSTVDTGFDYEIRATGASTSSALLNWSVNSTSSTASCALNSVGNMLKRSLRCTTGGVIKIDVKAVWPDSTVSMVSFTRPVVLFSATPTPPPTSGNTVTFRVRAGTGGMPWNTVNDPIRVFVGQTLTVYNDDTIDHRFHTDGDAPFPHQPDSTKPNASTNFIVGKEHSGTVVRDTYDHNAGNTASIYIEAIDGSLRYNLANGPGSCASCHGGNLATSQVRGASFTSIKNAIAGNKGGMRTITLSDQELRAIAYVLNK